MDDYKGTKMNQTRRRIAYENAVESWYRNHGHHSPLDRISQQQEDKRALGGFHSWIVASRAELAAVQSIAKAQSAMRYRKARP
jgi:hypothetical protein